MTPGVMQRLYYHLLKLYPAGFRAEYEGEIQMVFEQALESQPGRAAWRLAWRELSSALPVMLRLYWREWRLKGFRSVFTTPDLPARDGRHSWRLAGFETLFFLAWASLLALMTYGGFSGLRPDWFRDPGLVGILAAGLPLPIMLLGLGRGLPRWVYPFFGALLAYLYQVALRFQLELFLAVCLVALLLLAAAAVRANTARPLPDGLRRLGRSLLLDPLRWPFAVYGAAPILLLRAYDDGLANNHTLYLLLSTLGMLSGGLLYARLRAPLGRAAALAAGLALATWPAVLDRAALTGSLQASDAAAALGLWAAAAACMFIPPLIPRASIELTRMLTKGG